MRFLSCLIATVLPTSLFATHIVGGSIGWKRIETGDDAGKYIFVVSLIRDCTSMVQPLPNYPLLRVEQNGNLDFVPLLLQSETDLSNSNCGITCISTPSPTQGAFSQMTLHSAPYSLSGYSANPIQLAFNICCRSDSDNIPNSSNTNIYYSATMYPINTPIGLQIIDNSPWPKLLPSLTSCIGSTFDWLPGFVDADGDSLSYEPAIILGESGVALTYGNGFSHDQPFPGPTINPTYSTAQFDQNTGRWLYPIPSQLQGRYFVGTKVKAYRCGQLISENYAEFVAYFVPCNSTLDPPQFIPSVSETLPGLPSDYVYFANAGDLVSVNFNINSTAEITYNIAGEQFSTAISTDNGNCNLPPCATISGNLPESPTDFSSSFQFNWQTECQHVRCGNASSTYSFHLRAADNHCPAHNVVTRTLLVVVSDEAAPQSPWPACVRVLSPDSVRLRWWPIVSSANAEVVISHATNSTGPFVPIDTLNNPNSGSYLHQTGQTPSDPISMGRNYYRIQSLGECQALGLSSIQAQISSIYLTATNEFGIVYLTWNAIATPNLPSTIDPNGPIYRVYRKIGSAPAQQIATTTLLSYTDEVENQDEVTTYWVELNDDLPCTSISNMVQAVFSTINDLAPSTINTASPNPSQGQITLNRAASSPIALTLTDLNGRVLHKWPVQQGATFDLEIPAALANGIYLLREANSTNSKPLRVAIMR